MSAALLIRDPDPARRRAGVTAARAAIERFALDVGDDDLGCVAVVWGSFAGGPVSRAPGSLLIGDAIPGPGPARLLAAGYAERLATNGAPPPLDGYHFAATFDEQGAFTVAVDLLGAFPVYYASAGDAWIVGTSPALLTAYPGFTTGPDPEGLAALLVSNGSVRGRTPYRGIRRLAAGHALVAAAGDRPQEVSIHTIRLHDESHDVPVEECALRLHETFVDACKRHVPAEVPHTVLLSGGIDSRLVIGVLAGQGVPLNAITRGDASDLEFRCARGVANSLGVPHHRVPHTDSTFEQFERTLWWEGLACGPGSGTFDLGERIPHMRPHLTAGYMADPILGGVTATKTFDREARRASFDYFLQRTNVWGVALDVLPRLLRRDVFGDAVATVCDELRRDFMGCADTWLGRSWLHTMQLRERFAMGHTCGLLAFGSWPRLPQNDRTMLHAASGIPLPVLAGRRLEHELLKRFHTKLARLPLDRNHPNTTPPLADVKALVRAGIDRRIRAARGALGFPRPDRRYYHRTYDFNGSGWRGLRRGAESDRERAYALFDRKTFDRLVPEPGAPFDARGTIEGAAAAKMLTGIAVWLRAAFP